MDRHLAGLSVLGGMCTAVGQGRLAVHLVVWRVEETPTGVLVILLSAHIGQPGRCCSKLAEEQTAGEELAGHQEELCILQLGALWGPACLAEHKKVVSHMGCRDIE